MCIFFVFGSFSPFSLLQFSKCSVSCGTGIQVRKIDCIPSVSWNASHTVKHLHRPNGSGGGSGGVGNKDNDGNANNNNNGKNGRIELLSDGQNVPATQLTGATISMGCDPKLKPIATQSCTPGIECTTIINANIGGEASGGSNDDGNGSNEEFNQFTNVSNENADANENGNVSAGENEENSNENEGETENENANQEENENSTDIGESDADGSNGNDHSETDQTEVTEEDVNVDHPNPKQPYEVSVETDNENAGGEEEEEATASNENASVETDADAISEEVKEIEVFTSLFW